MQKEQNDIGLDSFITRALRKEFALDIMLKFSIMMGFYKN